MDFGRVLGINYFYVILLTKVNSMEIPHHIYPPTHIHHTSELTQQHLMLPHHTHPHTRPMHQLTTCKYFIEISDSKTMMDDISLDQTHTILLFYINLQ